MRRFIGSTGAGWCVSSALLLAGCGSDQPAGTGNATGGSSSGGATGAAGSLGASGSGNASGGSAALGAGGAASGAGGASAGSAGSGGSGGSAGAATADPCGSALLCERFDDYAGVTAIKDQQKFGPWHAALQTGATMALDGAHTVSGSNALHVHIDNAATSGGRLFSDGAQPIFATKPTHVYGRMMMYIDPNGSSIHWTFFGVNGPAEPSSPATPRNAQYILSSLPKNGVNTYSFVYGLAAKDADPFHDCSSQSSTSMPSAWACVSFELDSVARKLRMYKDGAVDPILAIDDHGKNCTDATLLSSPWYGPSISQLFVGAWSFHQMNAPLDVWIDDLVVDTKPVSCPAQ